MLIKESTISDAFAAYGRRYAESGGRAWNVGRHCQCWRWAQSAFDHGCFEDFARLHEELRRYWQVFRAGGSRWTVQELFERLRELSAEVRDLRLSRLDDGAIPAIADVVNAMCGIKRTKHGPSIVAISKFLHFWNPGLFVIVDDAVVWRFVLQHGWLRAPFLAAVEHVAPLVSGCLGRPGRPGGGCDPCSYVGILSWASASLKRNPTIAPAFADLVRGMAGPEAGGLELHRYEAAAFEWLVLGLVEIPPPGVELQAS